MVRKTLGENEDRKCAE